MENHKYRKLKVKLGEGSFKSVYKAIDEEEGKEVAYNEVKIKRYEEETHTASSFSKEIALLKNIDHPYIIKIFDYWFTDENFVFITELMTGGTVKDYIDRVGPLKVKLIRKWGKQILEGLEYLHSCEPQIVHRDIKNENIFVSSQGDIKIGDLGVAKEKKHKRYTIIGTPNFMAREMFEGEGYTEKVDVYAFGMSLIEMATGITPYNELKDNADVYKTILQGVLPRSIHLIKNNCLKSLIMGCLVSHQHRYSAAMCLDHHFFHPNVECHGDCIPRVCSAIYPLPSTSESLELSIISFCGETITFQILLGESGRFIKFDYETSRDTPQKIFDELCNESILQPEAFAVFMNLLESGIEVALKKREAGKMLDGVIDIDSGEVGKMDESLVLNNALNEPIVDDDSDEPGDFEFGKKTIEVMMEIDEEIKAMEKKKLEDKKREEEVAMRLKAKLEGKVPTTFSEDFKRMSMESVCSVDNKCTSHCENRNEQGIASDPIYNCSRPCHSDCKNPLGDSTKCTAESSLSSTMIHNSINDLSINSKSSALYSKQLSSDHVNNNLKNEVQNIQQDNLKSSFNGSSCLNNNCASGLVNNKESINISNTNTLQNNIKSPTALHSTSTNNGNLNSPILNNSYGNINNNFNSSSQCTTCTCNSSVNSTINEISQPTNSIHPCNNNVCYNTPSSQNSKGDVSALESDNSKTSTLKFSPNLTQEQFQKDSSIFSPPISSPPFYSTKLMDEQVVNDQSLNESYDIFKAKYRSNYSVSQFALDAATITGRTEDTAKSWIKAIRDEDLETVFDLKLMVYEDWERLPLTVFSSRAMQNMLYGIGNIPLKEKQLPMNPKLKDYENKLSIKEFLDDVCSSINRPELASSWENKLMAQDLRTVSELKSLHQDDWNRLGLSVFAYRILKNVIFRKGKIFFE